MSTEQNQDGAVDESTEEKGGETVTVAKNDYDSLNQTIGSLKRELKDLKQAKEEPKETPKKTKPDDELLKRLDSMALKMAGITADDEVELYNKWKGETSREADDIVGNKIFLAELADIRQAKANAAATDIKGGDGKDGGEKGTPEYWIAKATKDSEGELAFPDDLPNDFKLRAAIFDKLAGEAKGQSKKFYNSK